MSDDELLGDLEGVSNEDLAKGVAKTDGVPSGATVEPIYSNRKMACYTITQSELSTIGLANIGVTGLMSFGTGLLALALDIFKDTLLAEAVPDRAQIIISYAQPVLIALGAACYVFAGFIVMWRRGMIEDIKRESGN